MGDMFPYDGLVWQMENSFRPVRQKFGKIEFILEFKFTSNIYTTEYLSTSIWC